MTALFFLPTSSSEASPAQDIIHRMSTSYEVIPLGQWTLNHRLFRETPSNRANSSTSLAPNDADKLKPSSNRFLQVLSLSHYAPQTYLAITSVPAFSQNRASAPSSPMPALEHANTEPATVMSIPGGAVSDEFVNLLLAKFGPLWQPRHISQVSNGVTFDIGGFRARVGELKSGFSGAAQIPRGAICELEMISDQKEGNNEDPEAAKAILRGFWEGFNVKGAREVLDVPGIADDEGRIRQWVEILRLRTQ